MVGLNDSEIPLLGSQDHLAGTGAMNYQATIRYGKTQQRYLTLLVEAPNVPEALRLAAQDIPKELVPEVDLVELREAPDFDKALAGPETP